MKKGEWFHSFNNNKFEKNNCIMYVSTSINGYKEKPTDKQYSRIKFKEHHIDTEALYNLLINGHVIQCIFGIEGEYRITAGFKKDVLFKQTSVVSIDLDDIDFCWVELKGLISSILPTMMYTTYNHTKKGNRYRLLYCFDEPIFSIELYATLYNTIKGLINNCNVEISDNCGSSPYQMMLGTSQAINDYHSKNYNKVFSFSSFLSEEQLSAIPNSQIDEEHKVALCVNIDNNITTPPVVSIITHEATFISKKLIEDAKYQPYKFFRYSYQDKYDYIYRTEKTEWIDDMYQFIEDNYARVDYRVKKLTNGQGRRNWLYKQALLRRYICPSINIDTLFYSMVIDFHCCIDNSEQPISVEDLVRLTQNAFRTKIYEDSKVIEAGKKRAPKCGIILKRGTYRNIGDYMHKLSLIKQQNGGKCSRKTIYNERKKAGKVVARNSEKDYTAIYEALDVKLSRNQNLKALKAMGFKIGKNKVSDMLKQKLNELCPNT